MRFNCGPSIEQKLKAAQAVRQAYVNRIAQWRQVFVLWPRRIGDSATSPGVCVWVEFVWQRVTARNTLVPTWVQEGHSYLHPLRVGRVEWSLEDPR